MLKKIVLLTVVTLGITMMQAQASAPTKSAVEVAKSYVKALTTKKASDGVASDAYNDVAKLAMTFLITGVDNTIVYGITDARGWDPDEEGVYNLLITLAADPKSKLVDVATIKSGPSDVEKKHAEFVRARYKWVRANGAPLSPLATLS